MMKTLRLIALLLLVSCFAKAQSVSGEIYGRITDEKGQILDFATVQALQGGIIKGGAKSDLNGNYSIKPLTPGTYEIKVSYAGYATSLIQNIPVNNDGKTKIDVKMEKSQPIDITKGKGVEIKTTRYKPPIVNTDAPSSNIKTKTEIKETGITNTSDVAALAGGNYQRKSGEGISMAGDRSSGTMFMIDGMMVRAGSTRGTNFAPGMIDRMEVMSNGLSAKYGNATGGVIGITTRGIQRKTTSSLWLQHSVEGYNINEASFDIAGPLLSRKKDGEKKPLIGYVLNFTGNYSKDNNPYTYKYLQMKPEKLKQIQENPLVPNPNGTGNFVPAAEQVTLKDFNKIKARENGQAAGWGYLGKIDFQATENINVTVGTYFNYSNARGWSFANSLFAPEANQISKNYTGRGFVRLTQRLGKAADKEKQDAKKSSIQNAFYSIQFSYQKDYSYGANPDHGENIFDYGYVGKFTTHRRPFFLLDTSVGGYMGIAYQGDFSDSVTYVPGGINPLLENYTKAIYADSRFRVPNLNQLRTYGGLRNGDGPPSAFGLFTGPGAQITGYSYSEVDQATLNLDASFDILQGMKNVKQKDRITHNIQFGLGYDQQTRRGYSLSASGMWGLMRLLTNRHIQNLDKENPYFLIGGQVFTLDDIKQGKAQVSPFDTIMYNRLYVGSDQSRFDKELRKKLKNSETNLDLLDPDEYDPKTFSLNMFSPDDLFNRGVPYVSYFGYDYLGKKVKSQPSFNDFWTKKDARGDNARPIGAFRPIYMFGYILDRFSYKDLNFNLGVRIDRYDANQKVLKDPYSLYGIRKVGDLKQGTYQVATDKSDNDRKAPDPSTFDKEYVPYIDNNQSTMPTIVGYRKGDIWYDPFGKEITDPTILSSLYAGGVKIQPWLINKNDSIKGSNFNPNNSFEDYKPQVAVSPRIMFSFPISDKAIFYGNYDVVMQTPTTGNIVTADDYYFLPENAGISNANLRMEKGINYTLGYQQALSERIGLTLEAYYRERKNQIQQQRFLLAYPIEYTSYGNRDFASTKGMKVRFEYRRQGPLRMQLDYTLQFAEGTGSNVNSQSSLLATGQPNLRTVFPLDYDSRHIINFEIDYRYFDNAENRGPEIGGKYPFKNSGINLILRSQSGEPYTRSTIATSLIGGDFQSTPVQGTINGSRLPWRYELSTRITKDFTLGHIGKKVNKETKEVIERGRPIGLNVFCFIANLLNSRNTLSVYRYTGVGNDDGYLSSPQGQQTLTNQQFKESYRDLYTYRLASPGNFNNPRRIFLGFSIDF